MTRKLEDGAFLITRSAPQDSVNVPANRLRPIDYAEEKRAAQNKQAAFRKH